MLVINIAMIVYVLTALLSIRTAYDTTLSESTIVAVVLSVIVYFVSLRWLQQLDTQPTFAMWAGIGGLIFSLFFISQFGHQNYIETPSIINRIGRLTSFLPYMGFYIHQNSAATVIELLLPIVVALVFMARQQKARLFWLFTTLVLLYAFVLTFSRGAYLGTGIAVLIGLAAIGTKRLSSKQAILLIISIFLLIALVVGGIIILGPRVPFIASLAGVTASRLEIYANSLKLAGDYIFSGMGVGGTFAMVYSRYSLMIFVPQFTYTHNLYLAILLGQGILGLAAFLVIIICFYRFVLRVIREVQITELDPLFYGAWIGVTATLVHGFTDARQYVESPFNLPLLFMGMALTVGCGINALRAEAFEDSTINRRRNWQRLRIGTAAAVVILITGGVLFRNQLLAAFYTNLGALDETRADTTIQPNLIRDDHDAYVDSAQSEYRQALQYDPDYPNANRRLGNLLVDLGAYGAAIPLLEKAYTMEPNYQATIKGLGLAYTWAGQTQEAACMFKDLSDVTAMNQELYTWQGYQNEQGQILLSAYALETAAILEDYQQTNMDVWVLMGDRFLAANQLAKAQEWYSRVLLTDPNNTAAKDKLQAMGKERIETFPEIGCK
jgi:O-antigen ligase/Tfp pilus assembly protein PilF